MLKRKPSIYFILYMVLFVSIIFTVDYYLDKRNVLHLHFIDVGRGDSILIRDANGFDILIDGGMREGGRIVVKYMRSLGVDDIEVMIATHGHGDHVRGLINVLDAEDIPVESVLYPGHTSEKTYWSNFIAAAQRKELTPEVAHYPQTYQWGEMKASILNPLEDKAYKNQNDASVVIRIEHGEMDFLLMGDASIIVENEILARGDTVEATLLKVGHHGSSYSTSAEFVAAVDPAEAIISVGGNEQGLPNQETIDRLQAQGVRVWRTDEMGTITVVSDGHTYSVDTE
jgi:beta-lactamase superfamily II metal-dependent hydrolase